MPVLCLHLHFLSSASAFVPLLQIPSPEGAPDAALMAVTVSPAALHRRVLGWAVFIGSLGICPFLLPQTITPVWLEGIPLPAPRACKVTFPRAHHAHSAAQAPSLPAGAASVTTDCPECPISCTVCPSPQSCSGPNPTPLLWSLPPRD